MEIIKNFCQDYRFRMFCLKGMFGNRTYNEIICFLAIVVKEGERGIASYIDQILGEDVLSVDDARELNSFIIELKGHIRRETLKKELEEARINHINRIKEELKLGNFWCWHKWKFVLTCFSSGDKFQCQKCCKVVYRGSIY